MLGIKLIDWAVVAVYLVGITIVGIWAAKRVKSAASFFIGDRKFGKVMMMFFMFGAGTHSDQAVSVAAKTYRVGASGIWYQWLWLFATPFFWLIAPIFRRMRAVTTGDYYEIRYNKGVGVLFAVMATLGLMVSIGVMLKGSSIMITAVSGGSINPTLAVFAMTIMFVLYGMAGGMSAAIITNFIQGILTIVLSFLILPFAMAKVGGLSGLRESLDPAMLEIVAPGEITVFFIAVVSFNALVGWVTQPHSMANCAAGRTEMEGRVGVTLGLFTKRICTIAWMLTGLCAIAMYANQEVDVDYVYGRMAYELLPEISPGLIGLFIACMLAAVMSSCDSLMIAGAGLFTENVYKKVLVVGKSDKHYVLVGRIASAGLVAVGILFAFTWESVLDGLETFWKISAMMGVAFWVGLFWRRATVAGAWAGTLVSFTALLFTGSLAIGDFTFWDFNAQLADKLPAFMLWEGKLYLPWQMIIYLSAGFVAMIVVSLFTRPVAAETLDRIFACLRTPIGDDEPETEPFTLPAGVEAGPRKVLINLRNFEIPMPSMVGMTGFLASWVAVGLLIGVVYWMLAT